MAENGFSVIYALPPVEREARRQRAYTRMWQCGAHYVVDSIADLVPCLDDIEARLSRGERPLA
jgi:phosphonoacetaldehyde hydrolase